eukprot:CAMPEP_0197653404 /NCGR_PEP_ID=MMETSP1338-20131121/35394_1 /TAXON_ID=43686 ORGANISM="Pelagodinium beii, Strain RCC1491" /NCGR_SAMPLE_ID=MMETSP1338 /ASSEMBLY_ACC=CAM_ASM_000754 /LENGTH=162 /DNA_ID=CAMNT_0043228507 /DNA_START=409 /DNA_END=897 /DNA_ORIENTATION=-
MSVDTLCTKSMLTSQPHLGQKRCSDWPEHSDGSDCVFETCSGFNSSTSIEDAELSALSAGFERFKRSVSVPTATTVQRTPTVKPIRKLGSWKEKASSSTTFPGAGGLFLVHPPESASRVSPMPIETMLLLCLIAAERSNCVKSTAKHLAMALFANLCWQAGT